MIRKESASYLKDVVAFGLIDCNGTPDGDSDQREQSNGPAESDAPRRVNVLSVVVSRLLIIGQAEDPNGQNETRSCHPPAELDVEIRTRSGHVPHVSGQSTGSVNPDDCHDFEEGNVHQRHGRCVVID